MYITVLAFDKVHSTLHDVQLELMFSNCAEKFLTSKISECSLLIVIFLKVSYFFDYYFKSEILTMFMI